MRTAIATVYDGAAAYSCALPLWCQQASHLARRIDNATVLIVTANRSVVSAECPSAQISWGWTARSVAKEVHNYLGRHSMVGSWKVLRWAVLLKLAVIGLDEFTLVLFADLDVDLRPSGFDVAAWRLGTRAFLSSRAEFVASHDHESPVNLGVWLAKPSASAFREALALLSSTGWTASQGFGEVGSPRRIHSDLSGSSALLHQLAVGFAHVSDAPPPALEQMGCATLANGSTPRDCDLRALRAVLREQCSGQRTGGRPRACVVRAVRSNLMSTAYFVKDSWSFVCGNLDQVGAAPSVYVGVAL